jgi:transcriptional regulator with XRE-family HTH domain
MATRERRGDIGAAAARRIVLDIGHELRDGRLDRGLSQRTVAQAAGVSASQLGRLERGETARPTLDQLCRVACALGLDPSLRLFPAGPPVRDAGQLAVLNRFEALLASPLRMLREIGLPHAGDQRAWDGMTVGGSEPFFEDAETRLRDIQAVSRRVELKLRDDPRGRIVILVVARTAHNRRVLAIHREALRAQFPLDGAAIARALRRGEAPSASGIIML